MVLVCGDPSEPVTIFVRARLTGLRIKHQLLDLRTFPRDYDLDWKLCDGQIEGSITTPRWSVRLDELTGVYFRNVSVQSASSDAYPQKNEGAYPSTRAELVALLDCLRCPVVNRQTAMTSNRSKPFQALVIRELGLKVPKTLVTNSAESARGFYEECQGQVIFKSISGVRSVVRQMRTEHFDRLELLKHGPTQFQEFVPGDDIRVHTVGKRLLAVLIQSDAVDYRYASMEGRKRKMSPTELPKEIETACLNLSRDLGLAMAGIDLRRTPSGDFYCFEVNASPAFVFFERASRPSIAHVLAELLAGRAT